MMVMANEPVGWVELTENVATVAAPLNVVVAVTPVGTVEGSIL